MKIEHDKTKWCSEREQIVIALLLSRVLRNELDAVARMLTNKTVRSLIVRGVLKVVRD